MKVVTLQLSTLDEVKRRAQYAFKGKKQGPRISIATPELLFRLMTMKRWELIRAMTGADPLTIREAARDRLGSHPGPGWELVESEAVLTRCNVISAILYGPDVAAHLREHFAQKSVADFITENRA